jgi:DNA-binding CsgD family transcriptional regulator
MGARMLTDNYFRSLATENLRKVMEVCVELHRAEPSVSFVHHCHASLNNVFGGVHFAAEIYQINPFAIKEQEIHTLGEDDHWIPLFKEHVLEHPFTTRMPTLTKPEVGATHMEHSLKAFHQSTLYNEFYDQVQAQNQIWIGLRNGNELLNCIYSREREYTEEHLAMLCLIQPHLETAWINWRRTRKLRQELGVLKEAIFQSEEEEAQAAALRRAIEPMPPRQCEVAELVALGYDNQQIADELKISILTVKKHLQLVFRHLNIQHRTELAAKWHQAYSIQLY